MFLRKCVCVCACAPGGREVGISLHVNVSTKFEGLLYVVEYMQKVSLCLSEESVWTGQSILRL